MAVLVIAVLAAGLAVQPPGRGATGDLVQKPDPNDCIAEVAGDCADGVGLDGAVGVAVSPDGTSVYVASVSSDAVAVFDRAGDGTLTQKAGTAGCISETGSGGCAGGVGLDAAHGVAVSPDGTSVYVASGAAVAVFDRAGDGTLTQKAGTAGCISETGSGGCADGVGLSGPFGVAVSPDGASVYVASAASNAVAVFDRAGDGTLTQKASLAACISETGSGGACVDGMGLFGARGVVVSPDGTSVYVASDVSDAVSVFDRAGDGTLTQKASPAGCISETGSGGACVDGVGLDAAVGVGVSPDGTSVYATSALSNAVAVFDRAGDGTLTQKASPAGCISEDGLGGTCADGVGLFGAIGVAVSPDGTSVYVASIFSGAVAVFDRDVSDSPARGTLTQKASPAGCISGTGSGGCADGVGLDVAIGVAVSPDGTSVYVASQASGAVAVFDREPAPVPTAGGGGGNGEAPAQPAPQPPVDTSPPDTTITSGPDRTKATTSDAATRTRGGGSGQPATRDRTPGFSFTSSETGSSFQCSVDGGAFTSCVSPHSIASKLSRGQGHTFAVRAVDAAGNTDPSPAEVTFKVKRKRKRR